MRFILTLILTTISPILLMADNFKTLWNQVKQAEDADLPKTELQVLNKIISNAEKSKDYGNLLAAQLRCINVQSGISEDSIAPKIKKLENKEKALEEKEPVISAIYQCAIGKLYSKYSYYNDDYETKSTEFYKAALSHPDLLAAHQSTDYNSLFTEGIDSKIFNNDLLHVIGMQTNNYKILHDYYMKVNNREAACYCALEMLKEKHKNNFKGEKKLTKSSYIASIDSLINLYKDLPIAGEAAIERYDFMESEAENVSNKEKYDYINYALSKWGSWTNMNILRNDLKDLTNPSFRIETENDSNIPGKECTIYLKKVVNINEITMHVSKLDISANQNYDPSNEGALATLKKHITKKDLIVMSRRFIGQPEYNVMEDSFKLNMPDKGIYLIEFKTDNNDIATQNTLLYVSDVTMMAQEYPDDKIRMIVVNATTGKPFANAKIKLGNRYNLKEESININCDNKGEAIVNKKQVEDRSLFPFTTEDSYCKPQGIDVYCYFNKDTTMKKSTGIYTDRKIYRPGQTLHVATITYTNKGANSINCAAGENITIKLRDANYKVIDSKKVTTDDYGTTSTDFIIPSTGLTGYFTINTDIGRASSSIKVEEYKRPTFDVSFPKVNQKYQVGDTITVKASAKTYAGMPVQGANVEYTVSRRPAFWWWRYYNNDKEETVFQGTMKTDENGSFNVNIPLTVNNDGNMPAQFYNFSVIANVTDVSGESHSGEMSIPLGTKATAFSVDLPEQAEKDSLKSIRFNYSNALGENITGNVTYKIDGKGNTTVPANTTVDLKNDFKSGQHTLIATCGEDTITRNFIIFSMEDKCPAAKTDDWFYQSAEKFYTDNKPVYVQVGSSAQDQYIYYTVFNDKKLIGEGVIEQSNAVHTDKFVYKPTYGDGVRICYAWVKDGKFYQHSALISKPLPDKHLKMTWTTFRDKLAPGQNEEWTLHISNPDGSAAKAQLMATMFDKSLDALEKHSFNLDLNWKINSMNTQWKSLLEYSDNIDLSGNEIIDYFSTPDLSFTTFNEKCFESSLGGRMVCYDGISPMANDAPGIRLFAGVIPELKAQSAKQEKIYTTNKTVNKVTSSNKENGQQQLRENLNETAFFYPALESDKDGNIKLKFTLPESITTWRFIGLCHNKEMSNAILEAEAVASKKVMVQPNMPRFLREGDNAQITTKIYNTTDKQISGNAKLEIINPENNEVVLTKKATFNADGEKTTSVSFDVSGINANVYICRITAFGKNFSDGEQHYLPILTNREMVTKTYPFTLLNKGNFTIDLKKMVTSKGNSDNQYAPKYTLEYTNNPSWLMIQALPSISNPCNKDAFSLVAAYYSNSIAQHIIKNNPHIKDVITLWKNEKSGESLASALSKNEDLKQIVLNETPWVMDADNEESQKKQLIDYFDESKISSRLSSQLKDLSELQNGNGSWSWWPGMDGSLSMTVAISETLIRLNAITGTSNTKNMLARAFHYMGSEIKEEIKDLKKREKEGEKYPRPSETVVNYLYLCSLSERNLDEDMKLDNKYLVKLLSHQTKEFSIYGKANSAIIFARNGYKEEAAEYLKSIKEYTVYKEDMGRYFDTYKALYSWFDYKIPSQVAAIEALNLLTPSDKQTVTEMQRWLLQEKRTQIWDSPINIVNAVWAFMCTDNNANSLTSKPSATFSVDGKSLNISDETAGIGYIKNVISQPDAKSLSINKTSDGISWGSVYAQYMQKNNNITASSNGMTVTREVLTKEKLKVGDRVKVRITIICDRDYDFVQVIDKRAACLEPTDQTSGYNWGYYYAPHDNTTNYYFNMLNKGKHTLETEYYIDRAGDYTSGSCVAECAYAPEFKGNTESLELNIQK